MTNDNRWQSNILAGAATVHDGLFLLLRRSRQESFLPDVWGIPAGKVERREDPSSACVRELAEETGLSGTVVELLGYTTFYSERDDIELRNLQLNFLVRADGRDVRLDHGSHSDYCWISLDDVESELLDSFTRKIMESARRHYKELNGHQLDVT